MAQETGGRFEQIRSRRMQSPEFKESYERTRRTLEKVQEVLRIIDAERVKAGFSKEDLASSSGTNAASLRRLLTSGGGNPTLKTVIDLLDALDIEVRLTPRGRRKGAPSGPFVGTRRRILPRTASRSNPA